jgi:hypothetical protein
MQPQSKVSEREERESSRMSNEPFKVSREALPTRAWDISHYVQNVQNTASMDYT